METYPNVSILMPTYNRRKFLPLIMYNLKNMDYDKSKLEWCILDDGKKPLFENIEKLNEVKKELHPMKINYVYNKLKKHIGVKRNLLVKQAKYKIYIMMDDDDIYFPSYIKHSIETLNGSNYGLVGSNHMGFGTDFMEGWTPEEVNSLLEVFPWEKNKIVNYITELNSVTKLPNLTTSLMKNGYDNTEIQKIMGLNFLDLFRKVCD